MLTGQTILCCAPGPWRDLWRSRHQIMSRLARTNLILWVEPRRSLRATLRGHQGGLLPKVEHIADGLYVFHNPSALPASGPLGIGTTTGAMYRTVLRRTLRDLGMENPILWLYLPDMAGIIGQYGERLVVYHCVDEYSAYSGMPAAYIPAMQAMEQQLLKRADVAIVTAPALYESKKPFSSNIHLVPNAADFDGFQRSLAGAETPVAMANLPRPVIGYVGAINDKIDYTLLWWIAASRPDWTIAMVGPVDVRTDEDKAGLAALRRATNVRFLGAVPVAEVPRHIAACGVCLLPYKGNERTRNISALKLYEYLACGKPVVSTDIPAAREGQDAVHIATPASFVSAITEAMNDNHAAAERRRQVAAANTWDQRVDMISEILSKALQSKQDK